MVSRWRSRAKRPWNVSKSRLRDAIFVDFLMDGMDGLETITEIKKDPRFSHTPVVMCTANEGDEYVQAAVDHGALGILAKPPDG